MFQATKYKHRPPHIYRDDSFYFITGRCLHRQPFLRGKKDILARLLNELLSNYGFKCFAWVIMDNHYHLLLEIIRAENLKRFMGELHRLSAKEINKTDRQTGRRIWYQYFDRCMRGEEDFWRAFNYIHHNPVKHGICKNQDEVLDFQWCSYRQWVKMKGQEWVDSCFENYGIADYTWE